MTPVPQADFWREEPAPPETGRGLAGLIVLIATLPPTLFAEIGIGIDGTNGLLASAITACLIIGALMFTIPAFGLRKGKRWAIAWYWTLGLAMLLLDPFALLMTLANQFHFTSGSLRDADDFSLLSLLLLVAVSPALYFVGRLMRSPWWQPWREMEGIRSSSPSPPARKARR